MDGSCPLVSVIIPVYNSENYVEACIGSVVNQSYKNLEIIVVNDGSTDGSQYLIEKYASADSRVVVINKTNEGLPLARRSGLSVANGKYIQHLDSDDTLLESAIECLVKRAEETNADIVAAPFYFCYPGQPKRFSGALAFDELKGTDYLDEILNEQAYCSVWSNFQRRSLFQDNAVETVSHIYYGEDAIMMVQLLVHDPKVVSFDKPILNYNRVPTSITVNVNDEKYLNYRAYQVWLEEFFKKLGIDKKYERGMARLHIRTTFTSISWNHLEDVRNDLKRLVRDLKLYPDLENLLSRRERKIITIYRISPWLGYFNIIRYKKQGKI